VATILGNCQAQFSAIELLFLLFNLWQNVTQNVMPSFIRVFVALTWQYSRQESDKLDITLDSTVFVSRVKEI
jgi:hypothetical protein